eukprot:2020204-Prymnesium_polylepis.1
MIARGQSRCCRAHRSALTPFSPRRGSQGHVATRPAARAPPRVGTAFRVVALVAARSLSRQGAAWPSPPRRTARHHRAARLLDALAARRARHAIPRAPPPPAPRRVRGGVAAQRGVPHGDGGDHPT